MMNVTMKHTSINMSAELLRRAENEIPRLFISGMKAHVPLMNALIFSISTPVVDRQRMSCLLDIRKYYRSKGDVVRIYPSLPVHLLDIVRGKYLLPQTHNVSQKTVQSD